MLWYETKLLNLVLLDPGGVVANLQGSDIVFIVWIYILKNCNSENTRLGFYNISAYLRKSFLKSYNIFKHLS